MLLVLAGMIGAGKSSYTEMIAKNLGTEAFYESVTYNPVLDKFYEDPEKWAFSLQIYFLNSRFRSIKAAMENDNNVLDRSIYEDALFTRINHRRGTISDVEMAIYEDLLENMMEELEGTPKKAPDLLIYLEGSFENILERIRERGRSYEYVEEGDERYNYFKLLWDHYREWYEAYDYSPKMSINIDHFDLKAHPEQEEEVMQLIKAKLKEVRAV